MLTSTCAILPSADLDRALAFYESLGFKQQGRWQDFGGYLIVQKDAVEVHFAHDPNHVAETSDHAVYIRTDDVDGWSDEIARLDFPAEGFPRFGAAQDREWGMREMHLLDPDGHLIRVGQFIDG